MELIKDGGHTVQDNVEEIYSKVFRYQMMIKPEEKKKKKNNKEEEEEE